MAVLVATLGLVNAAPAFAGNASSGDGTMTVSPTSVNAGSTGNQFTFTFTAQSGKDFSTGSQVTLTVPAGWTQPTTTSSNAGYTTATATGSGNTCSPSIPSISGTGPWTITVTQTCGGGDAFTLNYGTGTNGTHITAPTTAQTTTFTAASRFGPSGSAAALSSSPNVTVNPGAASKLAFTASPSGSTGGGTAFATQPVVTVQDTYGNTAIGNTSSVALAITTPASATLTCTNNTRAAVAGVATFAGCKIDKAGTYTLTATDGTLTSAVSGSFTISVGAAGKLAFATQPPSTGTAGSSLSNFQVSVQDAGGNTVTTGSGSTDTITLTIATGPSGGTFNSAASTYANVSASSGVATFSGLFFQTAGSYTLTASDTARTGITTATSSAIVISAAAANKLAFGQGPSAAFAGAAMSPAVTVQVQDQYGNAAAGSGVTVTLTPSAGVIDSGGSATTSGAGLATFGAVKINAAAAALTLTASAVGLVPTAATTPFNVTVAVVNGAALTDTASDGAGSGVKTVSYYYCSGYAGNCTSATGTLIGSSTSSSGNYLVPWSGQPANGQYRLVVVGTDNLTNASVPSAPIPVTVTN
jgi:hypothetical protein